MQNLFCLLYMWWLIICVNLIRDIQIAGKTWFLGVSVRMFLKEISIWIGRLNKEDHSHQCGWGPPPIPLRTWIKQKGRRRANLLFLLELVHPSSPMLGHQCSWFLGLQTWTMTYTICPLILQSLDLDWITPLAFLIPQLADCISWDFSDFIIV